MGFDNCFECGEPGHLARDCPQLLAATEIRQPKPAWCGSCDKDTRLIDGMRHGREIIHRCAVCHPLRFTTLRQQKRCGGCKDLIYTWDSTKCGEHGPLAVL